MKNTLRICKIIFLAIISSCLFFHQEILSAKDEVNINQQEYITYKQADTAMISGLIVPKSPVETKSPQQVVLPKQSALPVDFFSQAPQGNWGDPFQNACEEMSVLLVDAYLSGKTYTHESITQKLIEFTSYVQNQGYAESISVIAVKEIVAQYLNRTSVIIENPTIQDIEGSIVAGYPVIVPLAGRNLGNPHFMGEGPWYHMLVITGFTDSTFITQEVGTNFGANYEYSKEVILSNIHDYTGIPENIDSGTPRALVLL